MVGGSVTKLIIFLFAGVSGVQMKKSGTKPPLNFSFQTQEKLLVLCHSIFIYTFAKSQVFQFKHLLVLDTPSYILQSTQGVLCEYMNPCAYGAYAEKILLTYVFSSD